jgi:hypothetical protein
MRTRQEQERRNTSQQRWIGVQLRLFSIQARASRQEFSFQINQVAVEVQPKEPWVKEKPFEQPFSISKEAQPQIQAPRLSKPQQLQLAQVVQVISFVQLKATRKTPTKVLQRENLEEGYDRQPHGNHGLPPPSRRKSRKKSMHSRLTPEVAKLFDPLGARNWSAKDSLPSLVPGMPLPTSKLPRADSQCSCSVPSLSTSTPAKQTAVSK